MSPSETIETLNDAAAGYLDSVTAGKKESISMVINNFVRWYGPKTSLSQLNPHKLEDFAKGFSGNPDGAEKIKAVKELLNYLSRQGHIPANLASALVIRKPKIKTSNRNTPPRSSRKVELLTITLEQKKDMEVDVARLKDKRVEVVEEIKKAAADKDLKENAPYHAAREEKAKLDGKIAELEMMLKQAVVQEKHMTSGKKKVEVGRQVTVTNLASGQVTKFKLVIAREVDPKNGCISPASPIGKAIMGRYIGDTVEVVAPACTNRYCINSIE